MREVLDALPQGGHLCPGWLLLRDRRVVMLEVGGIRLAPLFPTADLARQFLTFCGKPAGAYPTIPADPDYLLLRGRAQADGCRGLLVVTGLDPWQALACSGVGQWTPIRRPDRVEVG